MRNPSTKVWNSERSDSALRLRGLLRLGGRRQQAAKDPPERDRLLDRLLRRLGLVQLSHVWSIAEPTDEMIESAYWILRNYSREWSDTEETLKRIYRAMIKQSIHFRG